MKKIRGKFCALLILALVLSSAAVGFAATGQQKIDASYNNIKISVNGTTVTPKDAAGNTVEPFIYNGTTYLPVRAVSSMLGNEVSWDNATKTVSITANNPQGGTDNLKALSDFWGLYVMLELAKNNSDSAWDIYATPVLQTEANVNALLASVSQQRETMEKYRDNTNFQMAAVVKGYAQCDAASQITYDNLKAFKGGETVQSCISKERANNGGIFNAGVEAKNAIFDILEYANQ